MNGAPGWGGSEWSIDACGGIDDIGGATLIIGGCGKDETATGGIPGGGSKEGSGYCWVVKIELGLLGIGGFVSGGNECDDISGSVDDVDVGGGNVGCTLCNGGGIIGGCWTWFCQCC